MVCHLNSRRCDYVFKDVENSMLISVKLIINWIDKIVMISSGHSKILCCIVKFKGFSATSLTVMRSVLASALGDLGSASMNTDQQWRGSSWVRRWPNTSTNLAMGSTTLELLYWRKSGTKIPLFWKLQSTCILDLQSLMHSTGGLSRVSIVISLIDRNE